MLPKLPQGVLLKKLFQTTESKFVLLSAVNIYEYSKLVKQKNKFQINILKIWTKIKKKTIKKLFTFHKDVSLFEFL